MTIPKGAEFGLTITVVEKDSFIAQDLATMDVAASTFKLTKLIDLCDVTVGTVTITRPADVTYTFEDVTTTTADYVVDNIILDTSSGLVYSCILDSTAGTLLTNATYFTDVTTYLNGKVDVLLDSTLTASLDYDRGDAVDDYYLKPTYQGVINIKFTDDTPERTAIIEKVYVAPTGVVCV
jgi:hypothetical protein